MTAFDAMRLAVSTAASPSEQKQRPCPECGMGCYLTQGVHSSKWFWTHSNLSDCRFNRPFARVMHADEESARKGEMFK